MALFRIYYSIITNI